MLPDPQLPPASQMLSCAFVMAGLMFEERAVEVLFEVLETVDAPFKVPSFTSLDILVRT